MQVESTHKPIPEFVMLIDFKDRFACSLWIVRITLLETMFMRFCEHDNDSC